MAWATKVEAELDAMAGGAIPNKPFADLIIRYLDEVSPTHRGAKWEANRLTALLNDPIAKVLLPALDSTHTSAWRDRRLAGTKSRPAVSSATVRRDWNLISALCNVAVNEWKWLKTNPFKGVKRPPKPEARDRLVAQHEIDALMLSGGYEDGPLRTITATVIASFLFAIETGMRKGEICRLKWPNIDFKRRVAHVEKSKNGSKRDVPMTSRACEILHQLPKGDLVFNLTESQIDALFRKVRDRALVKGLTFHDSRHQAITRLAEKLDILELARAVGHRDLGSLQIYFNKTAEDTAKKLD